MKIKTILSARNLRAYPKHLALAIFMSIALFFSSPLYATEEKPDSETAWETVESVVLTHMEPWPEQVVVSEFFMHQAKVLQLHILMPTLQADDPWLDQLSLQTATLLQDEAIDHDRLLIDFIDLAGMRFVAYDVDLDAKNAQFAWYENEDDVYGPSEEDKSDADTPPTAIIDPANLTLTQPRPEGLGSVPVDVLNHFSEWDASFQMRQFSYDDYNFLTFFVDLDLAANDVDARELYSLIEEAKSEAWFDYERIYIDLFSPEGYRYGAFDVDSDDLRNTIATFDLAYWSETYTPLDTDGPRYQFGAIEVTLDDYERSSAADESYLNLYFSVKNMDPDASFAPIERLQVSAFQDNTRLISIADFDFMKIFPLASAQHVSDLQYRFKLQSEHPLEIVLEDPVSGESASFWLQLLP